MMPARLQIERWAAWAPGLDSQQAWLQWLSAPVPLAAEGAPLLVEMPALMRRRVEPLGRMALQAAYWAQGGEPAVGPVVLASRWGEVARSVGMLQELAAGEALSPTAFSLSVHNAIGALYSIARQDKNNYQAVSAGEFSAEAGFVEAAGLLQDGAPRVLWVYFDSPLPPAYANFAEVPSAQFPHAFACVLTLAESTGISLACGRAGHVDPSDELLPPGLRVLRFLLGTQERFRHTGLATEWTWTRHAN